MGPSQIPNANGAGLCPNPNPNSPYPGCDVLLTPGVPTYSTFVTSPRTVTRAITIPSGSSVWLYNPTPGAFYTYDDPVTAAALKMV
jgi:hypothetical protein